MTGANVVPPNNSRAAGLLWATFDSASKELQWSGSYSGLSSRVIAAHFRGPSNPNQNAGVVMAARSHRQRFAGSAMLSDAEAADLTAGRWYVNISTEAYPHGEIRGQVVLGE